MAVGKTLYDVLEVARNASVEVIEASYHRLCEKLDPELPGNQSDSGARLRFNALREAYGTLSNELRRQQYDARLHSIENFSVEEVFWTTGRKFVLLLCIFVAAAGYWRYKTAEAKAELARIAAEREAAARQAEDKRLADERRAALAQEEKQRDEQFRLQRELESNRQYAEQVSRQNESDRINYERQLVTQQQRDEQLRQRERQIAQDEARRRAMEDERRLRELQYERMRGR